MSAIPTHVRQITISDKRTYIERAQTQSNFNF